MAKKVDITFKNPIDESFIDHLELWRKTGIGGTFAQIGTDFTFITGTANYTYEDLTASADGIAYYYEARAYNNNGGEVEGTDYNKIAANITISAGLTNLYNQGTMFFDDAYITASTVTANTAWAHLRVPITAGAGFGPGTYLVTGVPATFVSPLVYNGYIREDAATPVTINLLLNQSETAQDKLDGQTRFTIDQVTHIDAGGLLYCFNIANVDRIAEIDPSLITITKIA